MCFVPKRVAMVGTLLAVTGLSDLRAESGQNYLTGKVVEKVVCENPDYSYALYLPSDYSSKKRWPVLYTLDARGRALVPLERFREVAEQYGYIVASSYDTQSDGPVEPAMKAVRALWRDTHRRFQIDNRRVYMAGFSGEARLACLMADAAPGSVTGVIACGAGFSPNSPPRKGMRFSFFGLAGKTDFNHDELIKLDLTLDDLDFVHRIEIFDGGHAWPPSEWCAEAVEWMEVEAMRLGRRSRDETLVESLFSKRHDRAKSFEEAGRVYPAFHEYDSMSRDFAGLRDVEAVERKVAELRDSEELQNYLTAREKRMQRDEAYQEKAARALARMKRDDPAGLHRSRGELNISGLKKRARDSDNEEESLSAQRSLESVFVQTAFYVPRLLMEREEFERAVLTLSVAAEIRPESPYVWLSLARAHAMAGSEGLAVKSLRRAVENGFSDTQQLEDEPDLKSLKDREDFIELLSEMAPKAEK